MHKKNRIKTNHYDPNNVGYRRTINKCIKFNKIYFI